MTETSTSPWASDAQVAYPLITELALAPDGARTAYVVREPLMTDEKSEFLYHIYLVGAAGGEPIQITFGESSNTAPRFSPDGQFLAFLSTRAGKANIYAMRVAGGEAWPLTRYEKTAVGDLRFSPDGALIAFTMDEPPSDEKEKAAKRGDDAERFDMDHTYSQLFTLSFSFAPRTLPEPRQLTHGQQAVMGFDWFPDSARLALTYTPSPVADDWPLMRLATIGAEGGEPVDVALVASWGGPRVSPDGQWIACATGQQPLSWAYDARVALYPANGGEPRTLADTPDSQANIVGWAPDSSAVYADEYASTRTQLYALPVSGEPARPLGAGPAVQYNLTGNARGQIACVGQDLHSPNGVYLRESADAAPRLLAQPPMPSSWPAGPLPRAEVLRWNAPDGTQIEGVLVYPQGYAEGKRFPLIVSVHGGPSGIYDEAYIAQGTGYASLMELSDRGYAVLMPNPRGSSGYGKDFRFANVRDWGGGDFADIMAGVDHLIAQGLTDGERLGIMGWSYGGFMTSWAITQTDRFKAACVGAAVTNLQSFTGTADIPGFLPSYFAGEFWEDAAIYAAHSPITHVGSVTTPALIQHGAADVRVPVSQGREFYNALKRRGVPSELVIYPRQGHGVDEPRLAIDMRRRAVEWLEKWIKA